MSPLNAPEGQKEGEGRPLLNTKTGMRFPPTPVLSGTEAVGVSVCLPRPLECSREHRGAGKEPLPACGRRHSITQPCSLVTCWSCDLWENCLISLELFPHL